MQGTPAFLSDLVTLCCFGFRSVGSYNTKRVSEHDEKWMFEAIAAARLAGSDDEVPVGAVLVSSEGEMLASAGNRTIRDSDPTAHAEIVAIRTAASLISNYRLTGTTLYTTVEPCVMCSGAIVNARIARLVFGTADPRFGAVRSQFQLCDNASLNHRVEIVTGVLEEHCKWLMQEFFRDKRRAT